MVLRRLKSVKIRKGVQLRISKGIISRNQKGYTWTIYRKGKRQESGAIVGNKRTKKQIIKSLRFVTRR